MTYLTVVDSPTPDNRISSYTYKLNGNEKAQTANEYDVYKRIKQKTYTVGGKSFIKKINYSKTRPTLVEDKYDNTNIANTMYAYDAMGRINSINNGNPITYEYDAYGQLVRENNKILDKSFQYEYNGIGNIVSVKTYAYTPKGTALSGTPTKTESFTYSADKLTAVDGASLTYDANGCLKTRQISGTDIVYNYAWDRGKLSSMSYAITLLDRSTYNYTYDAYGRRTAKSQSVVAMSGGTPSNTSVHTSYDYDLSGRLIREKVVSSYVVGNFINTEKLYLYDESGVIGMIYTTDSSSATYYFQRNIQGDVVAIYDTNGNRVAEYAYDAWGKCTILSTTNSTIANANPFRYRGYYYDSETGFYYLNARYYNPEWRRFISPDDTAYLDPENVNGCNLYCYCNNDPVNYADPSGHEAKTWLNIIGTVADYLITIAAAGVGAYLGLMTGGGIPAMLVGALVTTMAVNNLVNIIYYSCIPEDPNNEIKIHEDSQVGSGSAAKSYYAENGYINRWDRLKYIKSKNGSAIFDYNAWFDYAEYSIHMELWRKSKWAYETNIPLFSKIAEHSIHTLFGNNPSYVDLAIILWGFLGV